MDSRPATLELPGGALPGEPCPSDDDILAYLPGELSGPRADSIARHLSTCPLCKSRVSTLKQRLSDGLPAVNEPLAPRPVAEQAPLGSDDLTTLLPEQKPRVPRRLNEYELVEPIGRGGMGLVYKAKHIRLQRTVAIKVLPHLALADESAVARMRRESAAAGRVSHPNIVFATDAGECDGVHYLVMEFVEGIDLSKLVAVCGPLPIAAACEIVRQAALGLAHIAECDVVHRDLKPSNIMLASDGTVKILDLGLALLREGQAGDEDSYTQSGYLLGTADYVAPEQLLDSHAADVRSDLYSLGCTFYKLLSGQAPFAGSEHDSVPRKLDAHQHLPPPSIRAIRADVPAELVALLERLLAKRPDDRLQTPHELAKALAPLAVGADLAALYALACERADLEGLPLPHPSRTPRPAEASTQTRGDTPTPRPRRDWRLRLPPRVWPVALVFSAVLLVGGGLAGYWSGLIGGGQVQEPPGAIPALARGQHFDLRAPLKEKIWPGHYPSSFKPQFDDDRQMLEVRSDSFRLLELGNYDGTPGAFTVTIRQDTWHGRAGLFFGYRVENRFGQPKKATFQLFSLSRPGFMYHDIRAPGGPLALRRHRELIGIDPVQIQEEVPQGQHLPDVHEQQVRLRIEFGKGRCLAVYVDGKKLELLSADRVNAGFAEADYRGPWGLYHEGGSGNQMPTWFGDVVFTPLTEK